MDPSTWRLAVPLVLVAVGAGIFWGTRGPEPPPSTGAFTAAEAGSSEEPSLTVHVAGWVTNPGLVEVSEGARVADAVNAAGGLRPGADTSGVNLAAPVTDGEQILIPGPSNDVAGERSTGVSGDGIVHINRATAAELETLPGVGPVLAERIISHREEHGPFQMVEDLLDVSGIGEAKLAAIRDLVKVP
jgi:competence protein ComEA